MITRRGLLWGVPLAAIAESVATARPASTDDAINFRVQLRLASDPLVKAV
jgi:hypothetical protein